VRTETKLNLYQEMAVAVLPYGSVTWFKKNTSFSKIQVLEIKFVTVSRDANSRFENLTRFHSDLMTSAFPSHILSALCILCFVEFK